MTAVKLTVAILLGAAVLVQWLCGLGLLVMRNPFDKLHAIAPAGVLPPLLVAASLAVETGWSMMTAIR